eukprot:scaffold259595_cov36-Prasinocladus_malaysianus.AAC.1
MQQQQASKNRRKAHRQCHQRYKLVEPEPTITLVKSTGLNKSTVGPDEAITNRAVIRNTGVRFHVKLWGRCVRN